ncbi:MAG TPA: hypothetical protein VFM93_08895 [Candidatus Limnocylindria bacterium]|nr:hypothetical protein [Candidatus Limnocylindria bacterium]
MSDPARLEPPAYPDVVREPEDRDRFARLYDDLVRVIGMAPADALLHATEQFQLGFDVRGPFERRKGRRRVVTGSSHEDATGMRLDPPGGER